jgi:hypothetical protein
VHNASDPCKGQGVGYANARWEDPPYAQFYLRAQNHPNAPRTLVTFTRSVTVRLNKASIDTATNGGTDASPLIGNLFYNGLFFFYDPNDPRTLSATPVPLGPTPYERARVGIMNHDTSGHIIPKLVGGRGDLPPADVNLATNNTRNIFAQDATVNNTGYTDILGHASYRTQRTGSAVGDPTIYDRLDNGCDLCIKFTLSYPMGAAQFPFTEAGPRPYRPTRITVTVYPDGSGTRLQTRWWGNP